MNAQAQLRALKLTSGVLGTIPVATGLLTLMGLDDPLYASAGLPANVLLDSNLRFLGGVWLVLGLALWWTLPRLQHQAVLYRVLWLMVFAGGLGRALSMLALGLPPWPFVGFTVLELTGAPLFMLWHHRVVRHTAA